MSEVCPISSVRVDEKQVILNSLLVILSVLVFLLTPFKEIIYFLAFDFALRSTNLRKYSPLSFLSKLMLNLSKTEPVMVDAGPKIFAARMGLVFCIIIALLAFFDLNIWAMILAVALLVCAALEFFVGYCVGCKIYALLKRFLG